MKKAVIVIGYDTSYLEDEIKKLGYKVYPINYYNNKKITKSLTIENLEKIKCHLKKTCNEVNIIYGSGLENKLSIFSYLEKNFTNKGNKLNLLHKCGYVYNFSEEIIESGMRLPKLFKNLKNAKNYKHIFKPKNSCGGYDITYSNPMSDNYYIQEYIPGNTYSINFFIYNKQFKFLGFNKQFLLKKYDAHPFIHAGAGNLRNLKYSSKIQKFIKNLSSRINMRGFNSIDFKVFKGSIYVLDINPRITSTFKIYNDLHQNNLLKYQLSLDYNNDYNFSEKIRKNYGFVHIFPKSRIFCDKNIKLLKDAINLPDIGDYVSHGDPLFTIYLYASNYKKLKQKLRKKITMTNEIYGCYDIII